MLLNKRISVWDFIKIIKFDLLYIITFSLLIGWVSHEKYLESIVIPLPIISTMGTIVSLLLAFRTAQSYDRWWEARIVWGGIVNDSRTLIRQLKQFLPDSAQQDITLFAERQIIWNYALSESLRRVPFSNKVQSYLDKNNMHDYNIPNTILSAHSLQLKKLAEQHQITEFRQVQIDETLVRLCDSMGKCERIKNTVFPSSYSVLLHFMICVFIVMLPFCLSDNLMYAKIALTIGIPVIFIAIEKTAIMMQDPFENSPMDTPMTTLSQTIEMNILQQIGQQNVPKPTPPAPEEYYIM
ncbi:Predicted membrane protein [Sphingobacterium spiritivorum]|uniref:Predicted membrane protein n=1 Tax=Sphingobacterium spiritivorum TaxID=258 RepID=A0A380CSK0_SPHSI|nr:bestrophin family ion channel [Sphingobacterium spiritivorum]SUJ27867.1 Predicted membrane protein [Sphingobacterium spiritivorum]